MNILLTSTGRRTYMVEYFKNALHGDGLVFAANSALTYALMQADEYVITPHIYDKEYIDFLLTFCTKNSIKVIIPLFDIDLPVLAKNKERFAEIGVQVIVADEQAINVCNDKWETYHFLLSIGLKQPHTYISLEQCVADLSSGVAGLPLIIKPRWGMGSIGIFEVDRVEELHILYSKLHDLIFKSYLQFESHQNVDACIIIQEKIVGQEFGLDILNDLNGNYATTVAKRKLAIRAGETDIAQIVEQKQFLDVSKVISKSLKHIGNLDVDCFVTANGDIYVLEMNCRFGGQYPFSHLAGVDFPTQIIKWCKNEDTQECLLHAKVGVLTTKDLVPVTITQ